VPTLWESVEARFNAQDLIQLTRAGGALSETTLDQDRADAAVADVVGAFVTQQAGIFDEDDAQHVEVAVDGVIARLKTFAKSGDDKAKAEWKQWKSSVRQELSSVTLRARIIPATSSPDRALEPGPFAPGRFDDYIPDPPPAKDSDLIG